MGIHEDKSLKGTVSSIQTGNKRKLNHKKLIKSHDNSPLMATLMA